MLSITSHGLSFNGSYLELSVNLQYEVDDKESVGLEYFAIVSSADGSTFATRVETALLSSKGNETSIWKSFKCPPSFHGSKITVHYRAYFPEEGGIIELGKPEKKSIKFAGDLEKAKWEAGSVSTVVINEDGGSADLTITLECSDPFEWGWMVTALSGDDRGYEIFEPFKGAPIKTLETNTYRLKKGIQLDIAFLRAGPRSSVSIDL